jgi:hypothetical protein
MGVPARGEVALMMLSWQWPLAALIALPIVLAVIIIAAAFGGSRRRDTAGAAQVFDLDDALGGEHASQLLRQWRTLGRLAGAALVAALIISIALVARPAQVDQGEERAGSRDIVLCLDVSGSTLPYDREVIATYLSLVSSFQGERIGLSIFNSTSRTVFPLTDDYALVAKQLKTAGAILKGVETQSDIDHMSDSDYQKIADWLEGTQNRTDETSLIGDGVVSCAAMLPGFAYGSKPAHDARRARASSIVLATDNVVSGKPTYTLGEALDLTAKAQIGVDGLYAGPKASEQDESAVQMKSLIESHGGTFITQRDGSSVNDLVRDIERRKDAADHVNSRAAIIDAPGWWTLALAVLLAAWLALAWRLRR